MNGDDVFWTSLGSGAALAALITLVRILLEYATRRGERHLDQEERRLAHHRDAEARLERILEDRLAEADRRFERCEFDLQAERVQRVALEHDYARLLEAHAQLEQQHALLQADHGLVIRQQRVLLEQLHALTGAGGVQPAESGLPASLGRPD